MVLNSIPVSAKRTITGIALAALSLAQLPAIGPVVDDILKKVIVAPVTVGMVVGAVGIVGAYMIIKREGI